MCGAIRVPSAQIRRTPYRYRRRAAAIGATGMDPWSSWIGGTSGAGPGREHRPAPSSPCRRAYEQEWRYVPWSEAIEASAARLSVAVVVATAEALSLESVRCGECNSEVSPWAARCPVCGARAEQAVADQPADSGRRHRRHRMVPVIGAAVIVVLAATLATAWHAFDLTPAASSFSAEPAVARRWGHPRLRGGATAAVVPIPAVWGRRMAGIVLLPWATVTVWSPTPDRGRRLGRSRS